MSPASSQKIVWITGASSGIGEALAELWASRGAHVILSARREEILEGIAGRIRTKGGTATVVACDVTRDDSMKSAAEAIRANFGALDVAIANAGFGVAGNFTDLSIDDFQRQFETNVFGVIRTASAAIPLLRRPGGMLGVVGSVAGHVALPGGAPYSMSKFAVRALAESLWAELRREGISVTLISPGFVESEIRRTNNKGVHVPGAKDPIPPMLIVPRETAAREIVRGVERRRKEAVITGHGKVIVFLSRYLKPVVDFIVLKMVRARGEPSWHRSSRSK